MLKKVITIVFLLCFILSVNVMAENANEITEESSPAVSEQVQQESQENLDMPPMSDMPTRDSVPDMKNRGQMPEGMNRGQMPEGMNRGQMPEGMNRGQMPEGMNRGQMPPGNFVSPQNNNPGNNQQTNVPQTDSNVSAQNPQMQWGNGQFGGQMPGGMGGFSGNMQNSDGQVQEGAPEGFLGFVKTYSTPITSVVLLGVAFIFVVFYRRKNY